MEKLNIQRLQMTLVYLESKQRELKRQNDNDTRSIESMIKYLKKDMVDQYKLVEYHTSIEEDIINTDSFITTVQNIITLMLNR
ncbi:hypothetical protein [Flavobacterium hercynium]|uniref:Uncharacterized protein n=1 Tax=Flavobacterium hercynium TaxID=387094 RepID=A0A226H7U6_9FLAO|nr:hypothetical protein [Flavobacterium hercynium]OXA90379.1 hypothetical protein B0A66_12470 [Flavobacterium hercynium]SMP25982.1 hypothetical protein SAMN06265346_10922 [Flavobacterium hercynium]